MRLNILILYDPNTAFAKNCKRVFGEFHNIFSTLTFVIRREHARSGIYKGGLNILM